MSRQLPVPIRRDQGDLIPDSLRSLDTQQSPMSRLAVTLAPEILRAVERLVANRATRHDVIPQTRQHFPAEAIRFSEVEVDISVPFVQKITMRNATAWSSAARTAREEPKRKHQGLKRVGMLGAGGAIALAAGILARRTLPRQNGRIIDVTGNPQDDS